MLKIRVCIMSSIRRLYDILYNSSDDDHVTAHVPVAWPTLQVASPVRPSRSTAVQLISPRQMLGVERTRMVYTPGLLKS